ALLNDITWQLRITDPKRAAGFGLQAIEASEAVEDPYNLVKALSFTGVALRNQGFYMEALEYYTRSLEKSLEYDDRVQQCYGYINLANLYLYLNEPEESEQYLLTLEPLAQELADLNVLGYFYLNFGRTRLALEQYAEALDYLQQALAIRVALGNGKGQSTITKDIGEVY
ncbi:MAG TPA: hypothetical protein DCP28_13120, partial [Cytophagales bacterium]|nr:hypothetical protein [Cytophagales bacterium]